MKKNFVPVLALLASSVALAQSSVTLSGGVVIGLKQSSAKSDGTPSKTGIDNLDAGGNHYTMRATEDLGGGLKANVLLNYRFNPDTGATGNGHDYFANSKLGLAGSGRFVGGRFLGPILGLGSEGKRSHADCAVECPDSACSMGQAGRRLWNQCVVHVRKHRHGMVVVRCQ